MRLTFEALTMEAIFDQMALTLGERIQMPSGIAAHVKQNYLDNARDQIAALETVVQEGAATIKAQRLRIEELEGHLAHAVGTKDLDLYPVKTDVMGRLKADPNWPTPVDTKDLDLVQPLTKMPDSLKDAIANADPLGRKQRVSSTLLDDDVDKAAKPPKDMVEARRYPTGYWRLSDRQHREMLSVNVKRFGQMPNGDWVVVIA